MSAALHSRTPGLTATDSRELDVRQVGYLRSAAGQETETCITLSRHDPSGRQVHQWDPRLSPRVDKGESTAPNQANLRSLSGLLLLEESADSGWRLALHGETGLPVQRWDGRGSHWKNEYDPSLRLLAVHEAAHGVPSRVAQRCVWGPCRDNGGNCAGRLVRHDDDAGSRLVQVYALTGQVRDEVRRFLVDLDMPHWPAETVERDALLEPGDGARTRCRHGPLGERLELTDAAGNRQTSRFNLAGQQVALLLSLADGAELPLLVEARYNAMGQTKWQTAGNAVVSHCEYDPANGHLRRLSASRPQRGQLQDLHYQHDPVGNLLHIEDLSQPVSHFANQKVDPVSTFVYDSLYRLVQASGREAAGATLGPGLPELAPSPGDTSRLLNYRQHFTYDAAGNVLELRHVGQRSYSRHMAVALESNHALPWQNDTAPENPRAGFDANGNLLCLTDGQPLRWHPRNWLHATRQVSRDGNDDDEHYRYGADGLRLRKVTSRLIAGRVQRAEVRYLPGLELRGEWTVSTAQAGHCAVRCLVGQDSAAQLRYSHSDLHDSCALELDGDARIISHEGYYPFGGTAWWAARSAVEAGRKTHRYSGKERDTSGLYDYGLRYYAPWLARWVSPDPAGDVDGLNRFVMVSNNPLTLRDERGMVKTPRQLQRLQVANEAVVDEPFEQVEELRPQPTTLVSSDSPQARQHWVSQHMHHEFLEPYRVQSTWDGPEGIQDLFINEFRPDQWTFEFNFKRTGSQHFFASDVAFYQLAMVAKANGFEGVLPSVIVRSSIGNKEAKARLFGLESGSLEMMNAFFNDTVNGRSTFYLLKQAGLQAFAVTMDADYLEREGEDSILSFDMRVHVSPLGAVVPIRTLAPNPAGLKVLAPWVSATCPVLPRSHPNHRRGQC